MQSMEKKTAPNVEAYDLYLKGLHVSEPGTREALDDGIRCFEAATKKDPGLAEAYAAWGNALVLLAGDHLPFKEAGPRAKELIDRALTLDPKSFEAHLARGNLAFQWEHDWAISEAELKQAIALNPGSFEAHFWYAVLLATLERYDEAKVEIREAIKCRPSALFPWYWRITIDYLSGDLYAATAAAEELLARKPTSFRARLLAGYCYEAEGRTADALKEAETLAGPPTSYSRLDRAVLLGILGKREEAERMVRELEERSRATHIPRIWLADLYAVLGEKERVLDLLEQDAREGELSMFHEFRFPHFREIRHEPRFAALLRDYHLPSIEERPPVTPHAEELTNVPTGAPT